MSPVEYPDEAFSYFPDDEINFLSWNHLIKNLFVHKTSSTEKTAAQAA